MNNPLNDYVEVRDCDYKGEHYSVRDNGAILRHPRVEGRIRRNDNVWTFGKQDRKTAYMLLGTHRIHIIVATAFLGKRDSKVYVVDHIDTNRSNNRVENLRWFTRLENALNNPITRKRIEICCGGDIQKFIDDPSCLRVDDEKVHDISWMRTVSPEEAKTAMENLMRWAETSPSSNNLELQIRDKNWMFKKNGNTQLGHLKTNTKESENRLCKESMPTDKVHDFPMIEYLLQPNENNVDLEVYFSILVPGKEFSKTKWGCCNVLDAMISKDKSSIGVAVTMPSPLKPFAAFKIHCVEGKVVHDFLHTCFEKNGALQRMTEAAGEIWTGPDSIDNYC